MDSGVRKKRTLAERRESDKLRQRRFRAKKREEQRLLQVIHGVVEHEKKERVYTLPKKTADEIRETNRIRQQRFRAKRRGEDISEGPPLSLLEIPKIPMEEKKPIPIVIKEEIPPPPPPIVIPVIQETPEEIMKRLILQAANDEKNRQTEIRREKDRVRKRRERQRKRDKAMKLAGLTSDEMIKLHFQKTLKNMEINEAQKAGEAQEPIASEDDMEDDEVQYSDIMNIEQVVQPVEEEEENPTIHLDANNFIAQLAEMGFQFDATTTPTLPENIDVAIKQESLSDESTSSTSSSTPETPRTPLPFEMFTEKKPWQRCNTSEERRERERMRKRVYRAKRKYISTGKLEMQWDPSPIKRSPNDDVEEGITPLPEWNANLSSEQKAEAHRIYNKRYRERLKSSALKGEESRSQSREALLVEHDQALSSEMITELLSTISQGHLPSLVSNKVAE